MFPLLEHGCSDLPNHLLPLPPFHLPYQPTPPILSLPLPPPPLLHPLPFFFSSIQILMASMNPFFRPLLSSPPPQTRATSFSFHHTYPFPSLLPFPYLVLLYPSHHLDSLSSSLFSLYTYFISSIPSHPLPHPPISQPSLPHRIHHTSQHFFLKKHLSGATHTFFHLFPPFPHFSLSVTRQQCLRMGSRMIRTPPMATNLLPPPPPPLVHTKETYTNTF